MERHDELAENLEAETRELARESERLEEDIDETRRDWERKRRDDAVPGAQPHEADMARSDPEGREGPAADRAGQ